MTRQRATRSPLDDDGITLIEVMVALLVFAILATGVVAGMTTITRMTADNRARVVAANLASREIDRVRALGDPFEVVAATTDADEAGVAYQVNGRTFTVQRLVSWTSTSGTDVSCSSGTNLFYLRVNVRVTWSGMLSTTATVQDDTVLAPTARVNDTSSGAIGISVLGATNDPQAGVDVAVTPNSGGKALAKQPAKTDRDGCSYAGQVAPGNYDVTISKTGWIASDQGTTASKLVGVTAGTTQSPAFPLYAAAAKVTPTYVGAPVAYTNDIKVPDNLETTWTNTSGTWTTETPTTGAVTRFPYAEGYGVIAGRMKASTGTNECAAVDPQAWAAGTSSGTALTGGTRASTTSAATASSAVRIPIGVVLVKAPSNNILAAVPATPRAGDPACDISGQRYTWTTKTTGGWQGRGLPYGSWRFYYGTTVDNAKPIPAADIQVQTNAVAAGSVAADGTVTLDPRPKK